MLGIMDKPKPSLRFSLATLLTVVTLACFVLALIPKQKQSHEIPLGKFSIDITSSTEELRCEFDAYLYTTHAQAIAEQIAKKENNIRKEVVLATQSTSTIDLRDPGLIELRRAILRHLNNQINTSPILEVVFHDYSLSHSKLNNDNL